MRSRELQPGVRETPDKSAVVACQKDGPAGEHEKAQHLLDQRSGADIERAGRLVEQKHLGFVDDSAHERHALAFARG